MTAHGGSIPAEEAARLQAAANAANLPVELLTPIVAGGISLDDAINVTSTRLEVFPTALVGPLADHMLDHDLKLLQAGIPAGTLTAWMRALDQGRIGDEALRALALGADVDQLIALPADQAQTVVMRYADAVEAGWTDATINDIARLRTAGIGGREVYAIIQAGYPALDLVALADMGADLRWQTWPHPVTEPITSDQDARRLELLLISRYDTPHASATLITGLLPPGAAATTTRFLLDGMELVDAVNAAVALETPAPAVDSRVTLARNAAAPTPSRPQPRQPADRT